LRARARPDRPEQHHRGEQRDDEPQIVVVEDQLDHVADGGELDEGADHGDADVTFQVGALPH
jgi:hypothetical protein